MATCRHEIPTHLNVEDKVFFGFSVRQVMFLTVGAAGAYGLWNSWPDLPPALRIGLAAVCLSLFTVLALAQPGGRGIEEWAFTALHYALIPTAAIWHPREPDPATWLPSPSVWEEMAPRLLWERPSSEPERRARR